MRSIYIAIPDEAADQLRELARREFRAPRQQAAILVLAGLKRAGLEPNMPPDDRHDPPTMPHVASQPASGTARSSRPRRRADGGPRSGRRPPGVPRLDDAPAGT